MPSARALCTWDMKCRSILHHPMLILLRPFDVFIQCYSPGCLRITNDPCFFRSIEDHIVRLLGRRAHYSGMAVSKMEVKTQRSRNAGYHLANVVVETTNNATCIRAYVVYKSHQPHLAVTRFAKMTMKGATYARYQHAWFRSRAAGRQQHPWQACIAL